MARQGWKATGLLEPLWGRVGGRDALAEKSGVGGTTLSAYNSGKRQLGIDNARKIAEALQVSVIELGAPEGEASDAESKTLRDRLDELATKLGDVIERQAKDRNEIQRLRTRVKTLEAQREDGVAAATDPREEAR